MQKLLSEWRQCRIFLKKMSKYNLNQALKNIILSQVIPWVFFGLCIAILPKGLWENDGFSFFGVNKITALPYVLAILVSSYFLLKAKKYFPGRIPFNTIAKLIPLMAVLMIAIAITPYTINDAFGMIHQIFGILLFFIQFLLSIWLAFFVSKNRLNQIFFLVMLIGGLMSLFSILNKTSCLIEGQIIFQFANGIILINTVAQDR